MKRLLARHVIVDGDDRGMCIVEYSDSGDMSVTPFTEEVHSTVYVGNRLEINTKNISPNT